MPALNRFWATRLGTRAIVSIHGPIAAPPSSEPQPDVAVLRSRDDFYRTAHPRPVDIYLIIEVADSSRDYDRAKAQVYAQARVAEVRIVDLLDECIEIPRALRDDEYGDVRIARRGERIACLAFPDVSIPVADVLG